MLASFDPNHMETPSTVFDHITRFKIQRVHAEKVGYCGMEVVVVVVRLGPLPICKLVWLRRGSGVGV